MPAFDEPRTGASLFQWAKTQEQRYAFGFCRYITGYGRLNDFPSRMVDWAGWQVQIAYAEGLRRLARIDEEVAEQFEAG